MSILNLHATPRHNLDSGYIYFNKGKNALVDTLNSTICRKTTEYDDLKQANTMKARECFEHSARLSEIDHMNGCLNKELTEKNTTINSLNSELRQKTSQNNILTADKREKSTKINELNTEITEKKNAIIALNDEWNNLDKKVKGKF